MSNGHTFLQYAAEEYWQHALAAGKSLATQDWKTQSLDELPSLRDWMLLQAARSGNTSTVVILLKHKAQVKAKTIDGETAMHWAAARAHIDVVVMLLKASGNFVAQDQDGRTALHWAVCKGEEIVVRHLAAYGERLYLPVQDIYGWTALQLAVKISVWLVPRTTP